MTDSWRSMNPTLLHWYLQLFHHFPSTIPDKGRLIRATLLADPFVADKLQTSLIGKSCVSSEEFKLAILPSVVEKIYTINKSKPNLNLPCYAFITPETKCRYCDSALTLPRILRAKKSCTVYDNENPGFPALVYRKICTSCSTTYLYGEHVMKAGILVDEQNRLDLPFFKSTEETYFYTKSIRKAYFFLTISHMGGYKQSTIQNYANGTTVAGKKGSKTSNVNKRRESLRREINKKRLHDGILRFGILKMVKDIDGGFDLLRRTTTKTMFGKQKLGLNDNDRIDAICTLISKPLHYLHLKR